MNGRAQGSHLRAKQRGCLTPMRRAELMTSGVHSLALLHCSRLRVPSTWSALWADSPTAEPIATQVSSPPWSLGPFTQAHLQALIVLPWPPLPHRRTAGRCSSPQVSRPRGSIPATDTGTGSVASTHSFPFLLVSCAWGPLPTPMLQEIGTAGALGHRPRRVLLAPFCLPLRPVRSPLP